MKIEVLLRGDAVAALDEKGSPLKVRVAQVRNYGRGNQLYLPKGWEQRKVVVVDVSDIA